MREPTPDADPKPDGPDVEDARRTTGRLLAGCAALTGLVGVFQLGEIIDGADEYGAAAWAGVIVGFLALLGMIALYGACALDRATLRTRLIGRLDVFRLATVLLLVAVAAGVLIPTRNTTALALLLPWGISYWVHGLETPTSDEP
ncbi:hypothetical protein [Kribbella sp. CA-247076]|uniref:hypothetical protein n=1 Tax=Kribbella sp. CA-247076 TaxID=3239941 RepID=UPI003D8CF6F6